MEDDDLVLVVAEVSQGVEKRFLFVGAHESVGEQDNERALMELFGSEMDRLGQRCSAMQLFIDRL